MFVAIVALFGGPDDAIAASRRCAGIGAGIVVHLVTIITGFVAFFLGAQILTYDPIPTARGTAIVAAGIPIFGIAVIAGFAFLDEFIAAGW